MDDGFVQEPASVLTSTVSLYANYRSNAMYECPNCGNPLGEQGHNGSVTYSPQNFKYGEMLFCDELCCQLWIHKAAGEVTYDPDQTD